MNEKGPEALSPRRKKLRGVGLATAAAVAVLPSVALVPAAHADTIAPAEGVSSASHADFLHVDGLTLDVAGAARADAAYPDAVGPDLQDLDVDLLEGLILLNLGEFSLPLIQTGSGGLLNLGSQGAGVLQSYATSPSLTSSTAASGAVTDEGIINVDEAAAGGDPVQLELTELLGQLGLSGLTDTIVDELGITLGAVASRVDKTDGVVDASYSLADLQLSLHSPLVGGLATEVNDSLVTILGPIQDLLGPEGLIGEAVEDVVAGIDALPLTNAELNTLSIDVAPLLEAVQTAILASPLENSDQTLSVNLATGDIDVNVEKILVDRFGVADLNSLNPNTSALDSYVIGAIVDGITDAIVGSGTNSLVSKVVQIIDEGLNNVEVVVDIQADISLLTGPLVDAPVTVTGSISEFLAGTAVVDVSGINVLGIPAGTVLQPIINALNGLVGSVGGALNPVVTGILSGLQPSLSSSLQTVLDTLLHEDTGLRAVLDNVANITINEQPTVADGQGDLGADSFTVRALSVEVLPLMGAASVLVELASSTVMALDEAPEPVAITSPVDEAELDAGDLAVSGKGEAGAEVTVELDNGTDEPVSLTTTVTGTEGTGTWSVNFPDVEVGAYTITATQDIDGSTDDVSVDVIEPDATDADAADADATDAADADADATDADAADADATDADADATDADATDADATDADATDADATDADATDADATDTDATDADATDADATDADATDADATDADAADSDADATDADAADADATDSDATDGDAADADADTDATDADATDTDADTDATDADATDTDADADAADADADATDADADGADGADGADTDGADGTDGSDGTDEGDIEGVVITSPADGSVHETGDLIVTGTGEAGATVVVTLIEGEASPELLQLFAVGDPVDSATTTVNAEGEWTVTFADVAAGAYDIEAVQFIDEEAHSNDSVSVTFVTETTEPTAVSITEPADGATITEGDIRVVGIGDPGANVTVQLQDEAGATVAEIPVRPEASGDWEVTFTGVEPGEYTIIADQVALDGTTSTDSVAVTVIAATAGPTPVDITTPNDGDIVPEGNLPVEGTGEPGATVTVELVGDHGEVVDTQTTTVDGEGNWSVEFENVVPGGYDVIATQNADGVISSQSVSFRVSPLPTDRLPETGSAWTLSVTGIAVLMLLTGAGLIAVRRREGATRS